MVYKMLEKRAENES